MTHVSCPCAPTLNCDGSRTDSHQALGELGEPADNDHLHDAFGDEAMGPAVGEETESDGDTETADGNLSEGNDHGSIRTAVYQSADNDAAAKQRALALGLELARYSGLDQGPGAHMDDT